MVRHPDPNRALIGDLIRRADALLRAADDGAAGPIVARLSTVAPDDPRVLRLRGVMAARDGQDLAEAEALLTKAAKLAPDDVSTLGTLASVRRRRGDLAGAEAAARAALALDGTRGDLWFNLGNLLKHGGRLDEAEETYRRAIAQMPNLGPAYTNLGTLYRDTDRPVAAVTAFTRALQVGVDPADGRVSLAEALDRAGRSRDALACLTEVVRCTPNHVVARWNRSLLLLRGGDLRAGLSDFEWRWRLPDHRPRRWGRPPWDGQPQREATVLIHAEQGLGDTLMYTRWLAAVAARAGHVVLECQPSLTRLMARAFPAMTVVGRGDPLPAFDRHAPLMSVPYLLGVTAPRDHAAPVPYVRGEPRQGWAEQGMDWPRVGLVWQGGPGMTAAASLRSIPFAALAPLWAVRPVAWFSLQVGAAAADVAEAPVPITPLAPRIHDFADTADLMAGLDLVVTIDTAVAHLAGAMGVPTWILLKAAADWRWFLDRADSPWYPSATLIRQDRPGDWAPVISAVAARLQTWVVRGDNEGQPTS